MRPKNPEEYARMGEIKQLVGDAFDVDGVPAKYEYPKGDGYILEFDALVPICGHEVSGLSDEEVMDLFEPMYETAAQSFELANTDAGAAEALQAKLERGQEAIARAAIRNSQT